MLNKIRQWLDMYKRAKDMEARLADAYRQIHELKQQVANPTAQAVVNKVLDRPIEYVEWRKLDIDKRIYWGGVAKAALENEALQALIGKPGASPTSGELVKSVAEAIARHTQDFNQVRDLRMTMNGIELVREMLEEMLFEEPQPTKDGILDPI